MITPTKIDHTCLNVRDLKEIQTYLEQIFLFRFFVHPRSPETLCVEGDQIHFFLQKIDWDKKYLQEQHLSLQIDNIQSIKDKLNHLGFSYESGTFELFTKNNYHWVEWRGPNNIRWECVELI